MAIDLLLTLDENYIKHMKVLMTSIYITNPSETFNIYLIHSGIAEPVLAGLRKDMERFSYSFFPIKAGDELFSSAKVTDRYPKEMYYRLLAGRLLPKNLDKIIYIDPDTLVINSLKDLWELDISNFLFAAASHTGKTDMANSVNKLRLGTDTDYYNSGLLLINLKRARKEIDPEEIFTYASENYKNLILPDQDILNALYGDRVYPLKDIIYNYDARNYSTYLLKTKGMADLEWIMENTVILHFCGRDKPWKKNHRTKFTSLYKHYMNLAREYFN
ncbi:glycosyltransferase family 8 protein [uncultured Anaerococcus sp.]|uniref:glycosyltransferase family 8 protein n=1 Tax=uncultured Anaerococcus sp. TaxID=293428 RepID=UPI0025E91EEE|nr:glycosyltransferase family 8 protein [uncultured Anaerococcus sp.]